MPMQMIVILTVGIVGAVASGWALLREGGEHRTAGRWGLALSVAAVLAGGLVYSTTVVAIVLLGVPLATLSVWWKGVF